MNNELQFHELDNNQKRQVIGKFAVAQRAGEDAGSPTADPQNWVYTVNDAGVVVFHRYAPLRTFAAQVDGVTLAETLARDFGVARQRLASFLRNMEYREDVRAWASGGRQVVAR